LTSAEVSFPEPSSYQQDRVTCHLRFSSSLHPVFLLFLKEKLEFCQQNGRGMQECGRTE